LEAAAKRLFYNEAAVTRPYAVYGNVILPGQELPLHTDVPAYRGLDRGVLPSWLLTAMHNTRIFDRWQLKIATAVLMYPTDSMKNQHEQQQQAPQKEKKQKQKQACVFRLLPWLPCWYPRDTPLFAAAAAPAAAPTPGAFTFIPRSLLAPWRCASTALLSAVLTDTDSVFHGVNAPYR